MSNIFDQMPTLETVEAALAELEAEHEALTNKLQAARFMYKSMHMAKYGRPARKYTKRTEAELDDESEVDEEIEEDEEEETNSDPIDGRAIRYKIDKIKEVLINVGGTVGLKIAILVNKTGYPFHVVEVCLDTMMRKGIVEKTSDGFYRVA